MNQHQYGTPDIVGGVFLKGRRRIGTALQMESHGITRAAFQFFLPHFAIAPPPPNGPKSKELSGVRGVVKEPCIER